MSSNYEIKGLKEFIAAIKRNPQFVLDRTNVFLVRGLAEYRKIIWRDPWPMARYSVDGGGGAPVDSHNLRDTHKQRVTKLEGRIGPDLSAAPYAGYVHDGTRHMHRRPWLDYAADKARPQIEQHQRDLIDDVIKQLATT